MNTSLQKRATSASPGDAAELTDGFRTVLENRYHRILDAAGAEWERHFAGREPSDACVRVHISASARSLTGVSGPRCLPAFG